MKGMNCLDNTFLETAVQNFLSLFPLFQKKLFRPHDLCSKSSISPSHFHILIVLNEQDSMSVSEIGKKLHISKSNMTPLIDKLVSEGMVERQASNEDRRIINIVLADKGRAFIDESKELIEDNLKSRFSTLSHSDLEQLSNSLDTIKSILVKIE